MCKIHTYSTSISVCALECTSPIFAKGDAVQGITAALPMKLCIATDTRTTLSLLILPRPHQRFYDFQSFNKWFCFHLTWKLTLFVVKLVFLQPCQAFQKDYNLHQLKGIQCLENNSFIYSYHCCGSQYSMLLQEQCTTAIFAAPCSLHHLSVRVID